MIYLVIQGIYPNTAANNRYLGFLKAFQQLDIDHVNVVVCPDKQFTKIEESIYGKTVYLYRFNRKKNAVINTIAYALLTRLVNPQFLVNNFFKSITSDNTVIVFNTRMLSFVAHANVHGFHLYNEITEHPYAYKMFKNEILYKEYFRNCLNLDGLFTISTKLKDYFIKLGFDSSKIQIINMTVDSSRFDGLVRQKVEPYIAYCGSVSNGKDGVDDLIKSFAIVSKRIKNIKLYIIGKYLDEDVQSSNFKLIESLGLSSRVFFTGMIAAKDMPQLLVNAKILALARPSNLQADYGFPTKLGEYLLSETPVVITRTGDIPLFLTDEFNALLCNPGDCEAIAQKMLWVLENEKEAKLIGKRGKEVALRHFDYISETKKIILHLKERKDVK